jgi:hypothetical protein
VLNQNVGTLVKDNFDESCTCSAEFIRLIAFLMYIDRMASNLQELDNCTQGCDQPRQLEMGVTLDERTESKAHLSAITGSNEQVFGEEFEYVVS